MDSKDNEVEVPPFARTFPVHSALDMGARAWDGPHGRNTQSESTEHSRNLSLLFHTTYRGRVKKEMKISGAQVIAARNLLSITQQELADAADVSYRTVHSFEVGQAEPRPENLRKILDELERRGIEFTNGDRPPSSDPGIGVRLNLTKASAYTLAIGQPRKEAEP